MPEQKSGKKKYLWALLLLGLGTVSAFAILSKKGVDVCNDGEIENQFSMCPDGSKIITANRVCGNGQWGDWVDTGEQCPPQVCVAEGQGFLSKLLVNGVDYIDEGETVNSTDIVQILMNYWADPYCNELLCVELHRNGENIAGGCGVNDTHKTLFTSIQIDHLSGQVVLELVVNGKVVDTFSFLVEKK